MWVICIRGEDTGISIMGTDYYSTLIAAINFVSSTPNLMVLDDSEIDITSWEFA